jgi:hypothetical protein
MPSARLPLCLAFLAAAASWLAKAERESADAELAMKLNNLIASLLSVPLQSNCDHDYGPARDGSKFALNISSPCCRQSSTTTGADLVGDLAARRSAGMRTARRGSALHRLSLDRHLPLSRRLSASFAPS